MKKYKNPDSFGSKSEIKSKAGSANLYRLDSLERQGICNVSKLPYSIRILLEALLRTEDGFSVTANDVQSLARWGNDADGASEIPFKPGRVVMQDFTAVPSVVDLAALRSALDRHGIDPNKINPMVPVDIVIDHSVQVDYF
ncbi:MAG: aconitase family protein, partial [Anaerolineales bacterium]|nr:aconitase family protein [Anaerolineales bacterium]